MNKQEKTEKIVKHHVLLASAAGLVPVVGLDIAAVSAVQLDMVKQLCETHGIDYSESLGKMILSSMAGGAAARIGASLVKAVPVIGTVIGGISMPILSGASTYALSRAMISHFDAGGDLADINIENFKQVYESSLEKGKEFTSDLRKKFKKTSEPNQDVFKELEKLLQLKKDGQITEEEFEKRKRELMKSL